MMIAFTSLLSILLLIPLVLTSASLRGGEIADKDRELVSTGKEVCSASKLWQYASSAYKNPIVKCQTHKACNSFTDVGPGWQACCLATDCVCGTTQAMFVAGAHCARFTCTMNADCSPGLCVSGQCSFDNIKPRCTVAANNCGTNQVCLDGMCYYKDSLGNCTPVGGAGAVVIPNKATAATASTIVIDPYVNTVTNTVTVSSTVVTYIFEPVIVEHVIVEPVIVQPVTVQHVIVEPVIVQPVTVQHVIVEPVIVYPYVKPPPKPDNKSDKKPYGGMN
jgi:hypothetical protein